MVGGDIIWDIPNDHITTLKNISIVISSFVSDIVGPESGKCFIFANTIFMASVYNCIYQYIRYILIQHDDTLWHEAR